MPVFAPPHCHAPVAKMIPRFAPGNPVIRRYTDRVVGLAGVLLARRQAW